MAPPDDNGIIVHSNATLALAQKESAEHMHGMDALRQNMQSRELSVKAYSLGDPNAPSGDNVKTVHFVRHGQGFHNLLADLAQQEGRQWVQFHNSKENPYVMQEILDAPLTEKGRQQAYALQPEVQAFSKQPELIILSPNCRALQTGVIIFEHLLGKVPVIAHEMVREENGVHVCDKRRPTSRQAKEFPMVDFALLETEEDEMFKNSRRETKMEVGDRVYSFMEWFSQRCETHVGLVSHSGWLLTAFNGVCECDEKLKGWFHTGEMRSCKLEFIRNCKKEGNHSESTRPK